MPDPKRAYTSVNVDRARLDALQALAAEVGLVNTTGAGYGRGSLTALCRALADAYDRNPENTAAQMRRLLWPSS